jgi:hypothetical protein
VERFESISKEIVGKYDTDFIMALALFLPDRD